MRHRKTAAAPALLVAVLTMAGCTASAESAPTPAPSQVATPGSTPIAVIGDSMSLGVNACADVGACPSVSWALGDDPIVNSIATRLAGVEGGTREHVWAASDGGDVSGSLAMLDKVVGSGAGVVMVLVGANDACTSSLAEVTPPAEFATDYAALLGGVSTGLPDATILALSVPDLLQLWSVGRDDPRAVGLWNQSPSCRSLLADSDSDAARDEARRAEVDATVDAYNTAIAQACAAVPNCISDDGAVHAAAFSQTEISAIDYFHASAAGQARIAEIAWAALEPALPLTD